MNRRFPTALIVGRFDPPHLGHSHLIESATELADVVVVFVNSRATDAVDGALRRGWLAEQHRGVDVREVRHDLPTDFDDEELWDRWMALFRAHWPLDHGPHAVISSDSYVVELARRFDAESVVVDAERATVPVSATMIRADPAAHLDRLAPPVRRWVEEHWT